MTNTEDREMVMLSNYVGKLRNKKYINGERLIRTIEANSTDQKSPIFAKVFPVPNHFTVEVEDGAFKIEPHADRTASTKYRNGNTSIKSHRDYYILDVEAFEAFLDENTDSISYLRTPSGFEPTKKPGAKFLSPEILATLSPEEAFKYAAEMAEGKINKPKREMTDEHKAKITKALAEAREKKKADAEKPASKTAAKTTAKK